MVVEGTWLPDLIYVTEGSDFKWRIKYKTCSVIRGNLKSKWAHIEPSSGSPGRAGGLRKTHIKDLERVC